MRFKKILVIFGLLVSQMNTICYASEIDHINISDNLGDSHTHVYEEKFDAQMHWNECLVCGEISDETEHSLSYRYVNKDAAGNCSVNYKKRTYCENCSYEICERASNGHPLTSWDPAENQKSYSEIHYVRYLDGTYGLFTRCQECCEVCCVSKNGSVYKYADGSIVDPNNIEINSVVYNEQGGKRKITYNYTEHYYAPEIFFNVKGRLYNRETSYGVYGNSDTEIGIYYPDIAHEWFGYDRDNLSNDYNIKISALVVNALTGEQLDIYAMDSNASYSDDNNSVISRQRVFLPEGVDELPKYNLVPQLELTHPDGRRIVYTGDAVPFEYCGRVTINSAKLVS